MKRYIVTKSPETLEQYDQVISASINYFLEKIDKEDTIEIYYDKTDECKVLWICLNYALNFSKSQLKDKTIVINASLFNYWHAKYKKLKSYRKSTEIKVKRESKPIDLLVYNTIGNNLKEDIDIYNIYSKIYEAYYNPAILLKIEEKED